VIDCLLQFHIAKEETKFGLSIEEAIELLESTEHNELKNIRLVGIMGMASFSDDLKVVHSEFQQLRSIYDHLKNNYFAQHNSFKEISMGMSGDYEIAIQEGSTMVRVGGLIFGSR
jgi:uncharacterized pyridoxal phosphate-containing UPF0001 family protein